MGLIIKELCVIVDHNCPEWLITQPEGNPTIDYTDDLKIYAIFKRQFLSGKRRRNRRQRQLGDNCPLIYALKKKDDLYTNISSIKKLNDSFKVICNKFMELEPKGYQLIISMPSAHNISHIIAKRLAKKFNATHLTDILRKITVDNAFQLLDRADVSIEEAKSLSFKIKLQAKEVGLKGGFSLKSIPTEFRNIFPPFVLSTPSSSNTEKIRILLVDDLMATGTTLTTARDIIAQQYPNAIIHAICLFSSIKRQNKKT
ncbi:phosphoribosyltransferase family protein [Proteus terrae]|uniref:phosphoribosyltransferase family protein n=1 Tax=Proteus terrae TaxID=1574161 RepID=UPI003C2CD218